MHSVTVGVKSGTLRKVKVKSKKGKRTGDHQLLSYSQPEWPKTTRKWGYRILKLTTAENPPNQHDQKGPDKLKNNFYLQPHLTRFVLT